MHGSPARGSGLAAAAAAASEQRDAEQQEEGAAPHLTSPQKCASPQRSQRPSATDIEDVAAAGGPDAQHTAAANDCPPREAILREWLCVVGSMSCAGSALRSAQLEMPAKDPCYISTINKVGAPGTWPPAGGHCPLPSPDKQLLSGHAAQSTLRCTTSTYPPTLPVILMHLCILCLQMLDAYPFITTPLDALARHCSLEDLSLWGPKLERLLRGALVATDPVDVATLEGSMACIKVGAGSSCTSRSSAAVHVAMTKTSSGNQAGSNALCVPCRHFPLELHGC